MVFFQNYYYYYFLHCFIMVLLQVYEGLVYMDFDKQLIDKQGYGTDH